MKFLSSATIIKYLLLSVVHIVVFVVAIYFWNQQNTKINTLTTDLAAAKSIPQVAPAQTCKYGMWDLPTETAGQWGTKQTTIVLRNIEAIKDGKGQVVNYQDRVLKLDTVKKTFKLDVSNSAIGEGLLLEGMYVEKNGKYQLSYEKNSSYSGVLEFSQASPQSNEILVFTGTADKSYGPVKGARFITYWWE